MRKLCKHIERVRTGWESVSWRYFGKFAVTQPPVAVCTLYIQCCTYHTFHIISWQDSAVHWSAVGVLGGGGSPSASCCCRCLVTFWSLHFALNDIFQPCSPLACRCCFLRKQGCDSVQTFIHPKRWCRTLQTILNFRQKDCLRTRKVSRLHCLQSFRKLSDFLKNVQIFGRFSDFWKHFLIFGRQQHQQRQS